MSLSTPLSPAVAAVAAKLRLPVERHNGLTGQLDGRWTVCVEADPPSRLWVALIGKAGPDLEAAMEKALRLADLRSNAQPVWVAALEGELVLAVQLRGLDAQSPALASQSLERLQALAQRLPH